MRTHLTLAAAATAAALALAPGAALAGPGSVKDTAGDAPAAADITRVSVDNGPTRLTIAVTLGKPTAGRTDLAATLDPVAPGAATYLVRATAGAPTAQSQRGSDHVKGKGKDAKTKPAEPSTTGVTLEQVAADGTVSEVSCPGLHATLSSGRHGRSHLRVPQSCLGADAGDLVVTVTTETGTGVTVDAARALHAEKG